MRKILLRHFLYPLLIVLLIGGELNAGESCEHESRQLRWLVQRYGAERTQLEFALATSESRRQLAEAEIVRLIQALESARAGTTNRAK